MLWCMVELQPADGSAFAITYRQASEGIGVGYALGAHAVLSLRAKRLLVVSRKGHAGRANEYRVPNPLPAAPAAAQVPPAEGGAA